MTFSIVPQESGSAFCSPPIPKSGGEYLPGGPRAQNLVLKILHYNSQDRGLGTRWNADEGVWKGDCKGHHILTLLIHLHASSSSLLVEEAWGYGFSAHLGRACPHSSASSAGPQFTPVPYRFPDSRSPCARSGASRTPARTWSGRSGSSRAGSGRWTRPGRQVTSRPTGRAAKFRKPETSVGGACSAGPPRLALKGGARRRGACTPSVSMPSYLWQQLGCKNHKRPPRPQSQGFPWPHLGRKTSLVEEGSLGSGDPTIRADLLCLW